MDNHKDVFEEYLKSKDLKLTSKRLKILNAVFENHGHFSVESLFNEIQNQNTDGEIVSRATIYRTIPLLIEANLIKVSEKISETENYEHIYGHPKHAHLVCIKCNKIIEEDEDKQMKKALKAIAQKFDFKISDFNICIKGECRECQSKD